MKNRLMMILQKNIRNQQLKNTLILKPTRPLFYPIILNMIQIRNLNGIDSMSAKSIYSINWNN